MLTSEGVIVLFQRKNENIWNIDIKMSRSLYTVLGKTYCNTFTYYVTVSYSSYTQAYDILSDPKRVWKICTLESWQTRQQLSKVKTHVVNNDCEIYLLNNRVNSFLLLMMIFLISLSFQMLEMIHRNPLAKSYEIWFKFKNNYLH